jgi:hypothetical protein
MWLQHGEAEMHESHDQHQTLAAGLRALAESETTAGASPAVKAHLLEELRAVRRARRASQAKMYALAASLFLATAVPIVQLATRPSLDDETPQTLAVVPDDEIATAFYPLIYSDVPVTAGSIVRLEVPPSTFASFGVEPVALAGSRPDLVLADVLVGEDGLARAVRFVRPLTVEEQQERLP